MTIWTAFDGIGDVHCPSCRKNIFHGNLGIPRALAWRFGRKRRRCPHCRVGLRVPRGPCEILLVGIGLSIAWVFLTLSGRPSDILGVWVGVLAILVSLVGIVYATKCWLVLDPKRDS